jgi:hypothetical protein
MVSLTKLLRIMQGIGNKYKNIGIENFRLFIVIYRNFSERITFEKFSILIFTCIYFKLSCFKNG